MNKENAPVSPIPPEKAGLFLYGYAPNEWGYPQLHVLSSYTEGRFGHDYKCYGIPKGAIDPGETALQAALRETSEETGIDMRSMLGNDVYARLLQGETLTDIPSQRYNGVTLKHMAPHPVSEHEYTSGHGVKRMGHYFAAELEGIEKLRPYLKQMHPYESEESAKIYKTTRSWAREKHMPSFTELLSIMRTGVIPAHDNVAWAKPKAQAIISHPVLPELERRWVQEQKGKPATTLAEWQKFCTDIRGKDFARLEGDVKTLKAYLEAHGIISDNGVHLKLDSRDTPLNFYQEGGEVLPLGIMLERSADMARRNPEYNRAMWGEYMGKRRLESTPAERMQSAQIAPMVEYFGKVAPMEVVSAAIGRPSLAQKRNKEKPELRQSGLLASELFAEPTIGSWCKRVSATPPAADAKQTAR